MAGGFTAAVTVTVTAAGFQGVKAFLLPTRPDALGHKFRMTLKNCLEKP